MSFKVRNYSDIDISKIQFSDPKKTRAGSYLVEMYLKDGSKKENIYIQTSKMKNISGVNINENRSYIEFEFDSEKPDLYQFFINLDQQCIMTCHQKSKKWFNKSFPLDVIDEFYKSNIKPGRDNNFPTIKFKIPISKKQVKAEFYNSQRDKINHEEINENEELISVIHIIGMKFLKQQFILETQLVQSKICKKTEKINSIGYMINDHDSDYENDEYLIPFPDELDTNVFQDENNEISSQTDSNEEIEENAEQTRENGILSEINIESLNVEKELSIEDKNVIKEELDNISSRKNELLNKNKKKINDIQKDLERKKEELEILKRDQAIMEDNNYNFC